MEDWCSWKHIREKFIRDRDSRKTLSDDTGTLLFFAGNAHWFPWNEFPWMYIHIYLSIYRYRHIYILKEYRETIGIFDLGIFIRHVALLHHGEAATPSSHDFHNARGIPPQMLLKVYRPRNRGSVEYLSVVCFASLCWSISYLFV